jgi:hypothetical protein
MRSAGRARGAGQAPVSTWMGIMILGLPVRYGMIRNEIVVEVGGDSLQLQRQGEIFEALFAEEMDRLANKLKQANPTRRNEILGGSA